jgi:hypothetical protein
LAAPAVAGVIALYQSARLAQKRKLLTPTGVERLLKMTARPMGRACSTGCGAGFVDAAAFGSSARLGGARNDLKLESVQFTLRPDLSSDDVAAVGPYPKASLTYWEQHLSTATLMCDFDGDGVKTPVTVTDNHYWHYVDDLTTAADPGQDPVEHEFLFDPEGHAGPTHYVCGDFNGDGIDDAAVVSEEDDSTISGNELTLFTHPVASIRFASLRKDAVKTVDFGRLPTAGDVVVGDWDNDGSDDLGFRISAIDSPKITFRNYTALSRSKYKTITFTNVPFPTNVTGVAGNWDGDKGDTVGLWHAEATVDNELQAGDYWSLQNHSQDTFRTFARTVKTPLFANMTPLVWR